MNKYEIAKKVRIENFTNCMENMGFNPDDYTEEQILEMFDEFEDLLANDDVYSGIYNETLCSIVNKKVNCEFAMPMDKENHEDDLNKKAILALANEMSYEATLLFEEMADRLDEMLDELDD